MILSEFPLPDNATTFELYSAYRALNQPQENELDEVRISSTGANSKDFSQSLSHKLQKLSRTSNQRPGHAVPGPYFLERVPKTPPFRFLARGSGQWAGATWLTHLDSRQVARGSWEALLLGAE